jgi:hypothetical protein
VQVAPLKGRRQARLGGFDLHANTSVRAKNRPKLERLCRYLLRPPVAEDRLSFGPDGSVLVRLKTPWRDGTSHIALQPLELLKRLAALTPRPYVNLIVYHGVLAPNAKWRREVADFGRAQLERAPSATTSKKVVASHNRTWAELMRRGLDIDVLQCPDCGGRLRFVAAIMLSAPSGESSAISVFPQTQSSSHRPGPPQSSTTPGLVDRARLRGSSHRIAASARSRSCRFRPFGMQAQRPDRVCLPAY